MDAKLSRYSQRITSGAALVITLLLTGPAAKAEDPLRPQKSPYDLLDLRQFLSGEQGDLPTFRLAYQPPLLDQANPEPLVNGPVTDDPLTNESLAEDVSEAAGGNTPPIERYGEAPVNRTPQFLRSVTPLLKRGECQWDCGFVYALQEFDFPVDLGGVPARADLRQRSLFVPLAVRYGLTNDLQLFGNLPVGFSNNELSTPIGDDSSTKGGLGDLTFGVTALLRQNSCNGRSLIGTLRTTAPTGAENSPLVLTSVGLGNGVWQLGGDLLVVQTLDPIILFYGAGYTYSFERDFGGVNVGLGHQVLYNMGVGFAANERVTLSTALLGSYITETRINDRAAPGTDQDPIRIRLAATIAQKCQLVEPFVNFGITETAPSAELGIVWTH